jgi:REP-associated tyrosine transposase
MEDRYADGRRHPVHHSVIEPVNKPVIVFVTVCSNSKRPVLAKADAAELIVSSWEKSISWIVGRYVIMPNHVHFFCAPATFPAEPSNQWVRYWKTLASREWPRIREHPIWQRDFWDTQLRQHDSYGAKWQYVVENPVRAGLVRAPEDWPFQGELNELRW